MASNTPRGVQYPTELDKIKDGSSPSALADDFRDLAATTDAAIADGVAEAVADAATKYGGLPSRVTAVEQKNGQQDQAISDVSDRVQTLVDTTQAIDAPKGFDANTVNGQAVHAVNTVDSPVNMPGYGSWMLFTWPQLGAQQQQLALKFDIAGPEMHVRVRTGEGWGPWNRLDANKWAERLDQIESASVQIRVDAAADATTKANAARQDAVAASAADATAKSNIAKQAAVQDATTKYGALPEKVAILEDRTTTKSLGITDLDAVNVPGIYGQNTTGNATSLRNYPEQSRGHLEVIAVSGTTTVTQLYTASFTQHTYIRELYNSKWSPWKIQTPGKVNVLSMEDLDNIKASGTYVQNTGSNATPDRNYPVIARGFLNVVPISGTSTVAQVFHATSAGEIHMREFYNSAWGSWAKIAGREDGASYEPRLTNTETDIRVIESEQDAQDRRLDVLEAQSGLTNPVKSAQVDGDGLLSFVLADHTVTNGVPIPASLPTDQVDYVELMRRRSNTTTLELRKVDSTGRVEVSCVSPAGYHTTYEFKGSGNGSTDDDYRMQQRIWVGGSTGSNRDKTTLIGPSSNRDFAIQIAPTASGMDPIFMPDHGPATAWNVEPPRFYQGGRFIDLEGMKSGETLQLNAPFEVVQHVMGRHPDAPSIDLLEMWTTHTVHSDGVLSVDGRFRVVNPTTIGPSYFIMCPVDGGLFTDVVSSLNNSYPHNAGLMGSNTLLPESDIATSYVFLSSVKRDVGVGFRYNNPAETIRRGRPNKLPIAQRTWLEHRSGGSILKLYQRPWESPLDLPAGYTQRFSGDYIYMQAPNLFDQLAL